MSEKKSSTKHNSSSEKVEVNIERLRELEYRELIDQARKELSEWGKRRFWGIVIVATVAGAVGLSALSIATIQGLVGPEIKDAIKATDRAMQAAKKADIATDSITSKATELKHQIENLGKTTLEIIERQSSVQLKLEDVDKILFRTLKVQAETVGLQKQLDSVVEELRELSQEGNQLADAIQKEKIKIKQVVENKKQEIINNSQFLVVLFVKGPVLADVWEGLTETISSKGFKLWESVSSERTTPQPPFEGSESLNLSGKNFILHSQSVGNQAIMVKKLIESGLGINIDSQVMNIKNVQRIKGHEKFKVLDKNFIYVIINRHDS